MARNILIAIAVAFLLFVVVVASRPPTFHIERSVTVAAPPDVPFGLVNDFHAWPAWSPLEKMDPNMKKTFAGPPAGAGAVYSWAGNNKVGEGQMTIERSFRPSRIVIKLEFLKPFAATNVATFTFVPSSEGTRVTWAMDGQKNFTAKAFHMFVDMDRLVGADFERGLAALKAASESAIKTNAATANVVE